MKIKLIGEVKTVMSNPDSKHNYFGWPTVCRLQNGKIAVVASGFRLGHVCPFGKTVISYSEDEGETFTNPCPVIDTPLDDRDGGILAYGKSNVIVTSFTNTRKFQRESTDNPYIHAYLDTVTDEEEQKYLGVTYRVSTDYGVTFGEIKKSPVSNPHGPLELASGELLWVGRPFDRTDGDIIRAYLQDKNGEFHYLGCIENIKNPKGENATSCEPHTILLTAHCLPICEFRRQATIQSSSQNQVTAEEHGQNPVRYFLIWEGCRHTCSDIRRDFFFVPTAMLKSPSAWVSCSAVMRAKLGRRDTPFTQIPSAMTADIRQP